VQTSNSPASNSGLEGQCRPVHLLHGLDDQAAEIAAQQVAALAADAEQLHRLALGHQRPDHPIPRVARDRAVEGAAQSAVGGGHHDQMGILPAGAGEQRRRPLLVGHGGCQRAHHPLHAVGIGPGLLGLLLRPAQLGGGDHLHRRGDALRRLDAADADSEIFQARHGLAVPPSEMPLRSRHVRPRTSW
jgi:hypothetical protein